MGEKINKQWLRIIEQLPEPDLFLDFGPGRVNVCREAWVAKEVWPNCTIVGVEACESRYKKLKPEFPGELYHMAVDEKVGQADGYVGGKHGMFMFGLEKEQENKFNNHKKVEVKSTTVDTLYSDSTGGTVFIWADIEGAELRMLKGATELLSSSKILGLNLELCPQKAESVWPGYTGTRCTADQVIDFLSPYNVECRGSSQHPGLVYGDWENTNWFQDFLFVKDQNA